MSNHLSKNKIPDIVVKARKHLDKILKEDDIRESIDAIYDAFRSDDIEYVKSVLRDFFDIEITRYIYAYANEKKLDEKMADEIFFQYVKSTMPKKFQYFESSDDFKNMMAEDEENVELINQKNVINKKLHDEYKNITKYTVDDDTVLLDGKPVHMSQIDELNKESKDKLKNLDLPPELKELMNSSKGMKIDEFYEKFDEIIEKNGGEVKHSKYAKEMLKKRNSK